MKKLIVLAAAVLVMQSCKKETAQDAAGNLGIINHSNTIIVDSVFVNGTLYKTNIGRVKNYFPVNPAAGTVRIVLKNVSGGPIIVFTDSQNHTASVKADKPNFTFSYFMNMGPGTIIASVTVPEIN